MVAEASDKNKCSYLHVLNPFLKLTRPDPVMTLFDGLYLEQYYRNGGKQFNNPSKGCRGLTRVTGEKPPGES